MEDRDENLEVIESNTNPNYHPKADTSGYMYPSQLCMDGVSFPTSYPILLVSESLNPCSGRLQNKLSSMRMNDCQSTERAERRFSGAHIDSQDSDLSASDCH